MLMLVLQVLHMHVQLRVPLTGVRSLPRGFDGDGQAKLFFCNLDLIRPRHYLIHSVRGHAHVNWNACSRLAQTERPAGGD